LANKYDGDDDELTKSHQRSQTYAREYCCHLVNTMMCQFKPYLLMVEIPNDPESTKKIRTVTKIYSSQSF